MDRSWLSADAPLAMAYVPLQALGTCYAPLQGLMRGTLFPELDKPFCGQALLGRETYA